MHTPIATTQTAKPGTGLLAVLRRIFLRKLWLPRALYEALPYIYVLSGTVALVAALYLPGWTWILPYIILLGLVCLHIGLGLLTLRFRFRRSRSGPDRTN